MVWSYINDFFRVKRNKKIMKKIILIFPLIIIIVISSFLLIFLLQKKNPEHPPSPLLNEQMPIFKVEDLFDENVIISNSNLSKEFVLINFFASWCAPCKEEHKFFFKIKKRYPNLLLLGFNHKDKKLDAEEYLTKEGNPYDFVGIDDKGMVGLEFGVFGLPETFLVNKSGIIIYKHLGALNNKVIKNEIYPLLK